MRTVLLVLLGIVLAIAPLYAAAPTDDRLVVHEWGTFTSLQDDDGRLIGGINSDDEPVPSFCHGLRLDLIQGNAAQGIPRCHPDVTMRLETPVMYFHPPAVMDKPPVLDVRAEFHGGWLTQFFPNAEVTAPGYTTSGNHPGPITSNTVGTLAWHNVMVFGDDAAFIQTNDQVWATPRKVDASNVTVMSDKGQPEVEKYLFYRGVGHVEPPVIAVKDGEPMVLRPRGGADLRGVSAAWIADFTAEGCRAANIPIFHNATDHLDPAIPQQIPYDLPSLRKHMKDALVRAGLFEDEAEAMLATWELSYFKSPGRRIFYIVPNDWVNQHLPLTFSKPVDVKRVMIGRLELIAPWQRDLIKQIATAPVPTANMSAPENIATAQAYAHLGRFRNALVLDELARHPTPSLRQFIALNNLGPFAGPGVK